MGGTKTYAGTGVNYDLMDPFKRAATTAARETAGNLRDPYREYEKSRGESCYLIEAEGCLLAHVEEGLGTKNLVADAVYRARPERSYYDHIAQCAVAMIVNDMVTVGAMPLSVAMHLAVGSSDWFKDERRVSDLIAGWKKACDLSCCVWGGGETPTLKGIIAPETAVIAGSAMGVVRPKTSLISEWRLGNNDVIVLLFSNGIHANGLTLARTIAEQHPDGYDARLSDGRTFGASLLDPTHIYVPIVANVLAAGIDIHYAANITGHGWRKLMRHPAPFVYELDHIPVPHPVFEFIMRQGPVTEREMYANFNMGAGFALYVSESDASRVIDISIRHGIHAIRAGTVRLDGAAKRVVIPSKDIVFEAEELAVR